MARFEIHATDVGRAMAFYRGLFGWSFTQMPGGEAVEYHLIDGRGIGGGSDLKAGIMRRMSEPPASGSPVRGGTMSFDVDNCDDRYGWALANGGAEALPPMDYPGIGRCAYVEDGEGNIVGLIASAAGGN